MSPAVASPASMTGSAHYPKYSRHVGNNVIRSSFDDEDDDGITSQISSTRSGSSSIEWRKEELRRNQRERRKALSSNGKSSSGRNLVTSRSLHGSSTGKKWKKLASSLVGGTSGVHDERDSLDPVQEQHSGGGRRFQRRNSTKSNKSGHSSGGGNGDQLLSSHSMHGRMRRPSFTYSEKGAGSSGMSSNGGSGSKGCNLRRHNSSGSSSRNHPRSSSVERRNTHGNSSSPGDALKKSIHGVGNVLLATVVSPVVKSASKSLKSDRSDTQSHASSSLQTLEKLETLYKENSGLEHENQLLLEDAQELLEENDYLAKELEVSCRKQQDLSDKLRLKEEQLEQSSELLMQFLLNTSSSKITCSAKHMKRLREEVALFLNDHATSGDQIIDMERLHLE